jgi:hypothetical protein
MKPGMVQSGPPAIPYTVGLCYQGIEGSAEHDDDGSPP